MAAKGSGIKDEPCFDAVSDAVLGFIETGHTQRAAAALAGCSAQAISEWIAKGKADIAGGHLTSKHARFVTRLTQARGIAQSKVENALFAAAIRGNVTAAVTWLRARTPDDWSDKQTVRIEGNVGLTQDLSASSDDDLREIVRTGIEQAAAFLQ